LEADKINTILIKMCISGTPVCAEGECDDKSLELEILCYL